MKTWTRLIGVGLWLAASSVQAGWISGGGELTGDSRNPWFIDNTATVKACILIDHEHFHLPAGGSSDLQHDYIENVIAYWRHEFAAGREAQLKAGLSTTRI